MSRQSQPRANQKDIHCWLPKPVHQAIVECAKAEGVTITQFVRDATKEYLRDKHNRQPPFWKAPNVVPFKMQRPKSDGYPRLRNDT